MNRAAFFYFVPPLLSGLVTLGWCGPANGASPNVAAVAGTGSPENNGDSGPAETVNVGDPFGVEIGPDGALYIAEVRNHRVRRLDLQTKRLSTVAGCGRRGYAGDGGPALAAEMNEPYEVRFDEGGNLFVVEMKNHVVRRVDARTKVISTIAGNGSPGFSGDGGPASKAQLKDPHSIALDTQGGLYIADIGNHRIRRVDLATGAIESIAGNSQRKLPVERQVARDNPILGPRALFVHDDTLWIALREGHSIWRMPLKDGTLHHVAGTGRPGHSGDGGPARDSQLNGPKGIAVDHDGNIFVADSENNAIRRIDSRTKKITTIELGDMKLNQPHGIYVAADGSLFIGDTSNHRVWHVR